VSRAAYKRSVAARDAAVAALHEACDSEGRGESPAHSLAMAEAALLGAAKFIGRDVEVIPRTQPKLRCAPVP
jgi:hypothetical protein